MKTFFDSYQSHIRTTHIMRDKGNSIVFALVKNESTGILFEIPGDDYNNIKSGKVNNINLTNGEAGYNYKVAETN